MSFDHIRKVYFIGIGGIGMSALARYFHAMDKRVAGYDKTLTALTDELISEGIEVHFEDRVEEAKLFSNGSIDETLVVYTPAIPANHKELNYFKDNGFKIKKRSEVLGMITDNQFTVAVAGTHGKTTTSSIIAHILKSSGINCVAFLGGISKNYNSNLLAPLAPKGTINGGVQKTVFVVEADEYDRSFLALHPDIAVITSMDADHLDIYGDKILMEESYRLFAQQVKSDGVLLFKKGLSAGKTKSVQMQYSLSPAMSPGLSLNDCDYMAENIQISNHKYYFTFKNHSITIDSLSTLMPGRHNVENALAAIAVARHLGIDPEKISAAIHSYSGVKRRFDYQVNTKDLVFIDDYAHHPEELRACISSVRELYPVKKITGIFQPHLFSRTRDFANGFGKSLSLLDELILLDIYPAREKPMEGVTSKIIFDKVTIVNKTMCTKEQVMEELKGRKIEILLTLGAGDIDQLVEPIRKSLIIGH